MNYNASVATARDADRISRSEGPHGQVEAGSTLLQVVEQARSAMRLAGETLQANGAGSTGAIVARRGSASNRRPIDAGEQRR
jgi:hypothetical protein